MNPELNQEYPEPGEAELIERIVKLAVARMNPQDGHIRRGQHAKPTGCVRGVFTVRSDVPNELRHGVFREPNKTFHSIVRFSNSSETVDPDGKGTARGMAIKLLDVEGAPAVPGAGDRCQDFLMVYHPVFPEVEELHVFGRRWEGKKKEAIFDFRAQRQTDPVAMPVEDVSIKWDEDVSEPIPLATLTIGVQDVESTDGLALSDQCEAMAFSPWNALAQHPPMGGINRLRKAVYLASHATRVAEPTS